MIEMFIEQKLVSLLVHAFSNLCK